jgi:hypothetical protein
MMDIDIYRPECHRAKCHRLFEVETARSVEFHHFPMTRSEWTLLDICRSRPDRP